MRGDDTIHPSPWRHGPRLWALSAIAGLLAGALCGFATPPTLNSAGALAIPLFALLPFALLLLAIALGPLAAPHAWHRHYPDVALFLGALVIGYYLFALGAHGGRPRVLHTAIEYYAFIALVGGLFVASGPVVIQSRRRAGPISNTLFLAGGAILANLLGTTGASVLLIRPFLHANEGRLRPLHVVFFIFIVSNCGGCLTPIGDPPLYLGFLKGVPFFWTAQHLYRDWLLVIGALLALFAIYDQRIESLYKRTTGAAYTRPSILPAFTISARPLNVILLLAVVAAVFIDPALQRLLPQAHLEHYPIGATVQLVLAATSYRLAPRNLLEANDFSFAPAREVALLFAGIFAAMMPALQYFASNGQALGVTNPTRFYFATGALSAFLDNAPTYLNFLQIAVVPDDVGRAAVARLIADPDGFLRLRAISTGAVFFGAMTYIGNGPNFMVRSIAERAMIKMPSFLAYLAWACVLLLPVLAMHWWLMVS